MPSAGIKGIVQRVIRSTGFEVVRVPSLPERAPAPRMGGANGETPGSERSCVPGPIDPFRFNPWPIPPDLRDRTEPWAKELVWLYSRPASWPACISPEAGMFLHAFVRNLRPRVVVETGTCHAASTIWIAAAMQLGGADSPGVVHTFDDFKPPANKDIAAMPLFQDRLDKVKARLAKSDVDGMVRVHVGDSSSNVVKARPELDAAGGVQLAYIDGDHSPEGVRRDFEAVEPSLNIGGYVFLHDVFPDVCSCSGPRWLANNIAEVAKGTYQSCDVYTAPLNYGLTMLRRVG